MRAPLPKALLMALLMAGLSAAEVQAQTVLDGAYIKEHTKTKRVVPYPHIREADVMWWRRVWREIDLKEKMNHPLYYPIEEINDRRSLFDIIKNSLLNEQSLTAYDAFYAGMPDDEFRKPLTSTEVRSLLVSQDTSYTMDPDTDEMIEVIRDEEITSRDIMRYALKEDWIFEKQRSKMDIRIIGISPMQAVIVDGEFRGMRNLFWLYYPECRYVFANWEAFNRENDAERRSFEDIFWKRQFSSYITKWSNVYDRRIEQHRSGLDILLQSEEIKQSLFELEHDLWNF